MSQNGSCLCGGVKFKADGEPTNVRVCHCRLCQKTMGAPYFARVLFPQNRLTIEGPVKRHGSSKTLERTFCPSCGTTIGAWRVNGTFAGIALALFEDRNAFTPTEHIWVSEKLDWVEIADGVRQFKYDPE